jgi:FkbM family methyltransferase
MKIVYITPHLSTGGMPEYLRKKVELLKDEHDIWVLELQTEHAYRIIRDKIESLIGERLIAIDRNFDRMLQLIQVIEPDVIHFEELSDYHVPESILDKIYVSDRKYKIFETFHDSSIESFEKKFIPDKMIVVSHWQLKMMKELGVPIEVINHEIEAGERNREGLIKLGLDPNKKHVMQVGLFSRRKNQSETFELARLMPNIQFHFLGGLTDNYSDYWKPIIENKPDNCIIWNERSDVYSFYQCFDAVIFPSRGQYGDRETNPLVIRESIAWKIPLLLRDLPVYMGMYKQTDKVKFMSDNIYENVKLLNQLLQINENNKKQEIKQMQELDAHFFKKKLFNISFDSSDNKITFDYLESVPMRFMVCVRDIDTEVPIYSFDAHFSQGIRIWCIPIPKPHYDFQVNPNFGGFLFDFYDFNQQDKKLYSQAIRLKSTAFKKSKFRVESFDPLFVNYEQFFTDKIYESFFSENNLVNKLDVVIDVGANVGLFTEYCLQKGASKVYSVEINDKAIKTFKQIHGSKENVKLITKGLSDKSGEIEVYLDPENSLVSSVIQTHAPGLSISKKVQTMSFKELLDSENIQHINLLKIDVEGAEYDIFKGIDLEILSKIDFIIMEFHDNFGDILRDEILNKLEAAGFEYTMWQDDCKGEAYEYEERGTIFAKNK